MRPQKTAPAPLAGLESAGPTAARLRLGAQLRQLRRAAGITRQDAAAASGGPVELLRFAGDQLPDVVCLEYFAGAVYPSRPAGLASYWDVLNQLATQADPPIASTLTIEQLHREL